MNLKEITQLNEGFSADTKKWLKAKYPEAKIKGNEILIPMNQEDYNRGTLKLLQNFDFYCPENERHIGVDWGSTYRDGHAVLTLG